jgi:predicted enzyme related to lactoylglutathione lyase
MAAPAVTWFEVTGEDGPALQKFYKDLFEWQIRDAGEDSGYGLIEGTGEGIGGGIGQADDGPGQVTFYVEVDDLDTYLEKAEQLGGKTVVPPTTIEQVGLTFAFFADPANNVVGLSQGVAK